MHEDRVTTLGNIKVRCIYAIENFDEIAERDEDNKITIPNEFIDILNTIAISTTRGVMFTCFRGTFLHNAVIPVIDPPVC